MTLPAPVVERVGDLFVVRDDLLPGGTKRRALPVLVRPGHAYAYAATAYGYAQVALAFACRDVGATATIFVAARRVLHPRTAMARDAGATIVQVPMGFMSNVTAKARAHAQATGTEMLAQGFDHAVFLDALAEVARGLAIAPREVWSVAGTGTLSRALQIAWPDAAVRAVRTGMAPNIGRASLLLAPERFEQDARMPPPFPSCSNSDAKAWRFLVTQASPGALFWNVAA